MGTSAASTVFFPIGRSSLFSRLSWLFLLGMDLLRDSRALSVILLSSQHIFDLVFVRLGDFLWDPCRLTDLVLSGVLFSFSSSEDSGEKLNSPAFTGVFAIDCRTRISRCIRIHTCIPVIPVLPVDYIFLQKAHSVPIPPLHNAIIYWSASWATFVKFTMECIKLDPSIF